MLTLRTLIFVDLRTIAGEIANGLLLAALCLPVVAGAQQVNSSEASAPDVASYATAERALLCSTFSCSNANPFCAFTTISGDGRQKSFRVGNNSQACLCELTEGDRFCVRSDGQYPGPGCELMEVRGLRPTCAPPSGAAAPPSTAPPSVSAPETASQAAVEPEDAPTSTAGPPLGSSSQCATFSCSNADPFCAFTTISGDGQQKNFRVGNNSRACFCELAEGDRFCVRSDGQYPGPGCELTVVRGLKPAC